MASFRAARAARHREVAAARQPRRIRPELAARVVVTVAGLSAAGLLLTVDRPVYRVAGVLLALLVVFGWRWVEGMVGKAQRVIALRLALQQLGDPAEPAPQPDDATPEGQ